MAASATARGWGMGWPVDRSGDMVRVQSGKATVLVNKGIAPLVQHAMDAAPQFGYELHEGWCWGYANRAIRGSTSPSNHSWGLAVDLNAPTNPMGAALVTDLPRPYVEFWKSLGFRWGGDYSGRKDAMHFEYMGTVAEAAAALANLMGSALATAPAAPAAPAPAAHPFPGRALKVGISGDDVRAWQQRMRDRGWTISVDGDFGPKSRAVAMAFQAEKGLVADGIVGPRTWAEAFRTDNLA